MEYYKIALYSTNDLIDVDLDGIIAFEDLGAGVPGEPNNKWLEVEVCGLSDAPEQEEPEEMVGGHLKQSTSQRWTYEPQTRAYAHPSETSLRHAIYAIFRKENIFMANLDYDAPEVIAPTGKARYISGTVGTEHIYDDGSKTLTLKIKSKETE